MLTATEQDKSYYNKGYRYLVLSKDGSVQYAGSGKDARAAARKIEALACVVRMGTNGRLARMPLTAEGTYTIPVWYIISKYPKLFDPDKAPAPVQVQQVDNSARIAQLAKKLQAAKEAYYNAEPIMTDAAFDALEDELRKLDPHHPVLAQVGAKPTVKPVKQANGAAWVKVRHSVPMGSLYKAQVQVELAAWYKGLPRKPALVVSDKLDGLSVSCRYEKGKLVQAATRGDGEYGEDITRNVVQMKGVPSNIPGFSGHLRGEIIVKNSDFARYFPGEANPRNTAAGKAKSLNGDRCNRLTVLFYQVLPSGGPMPTKMAEFRFLESIPGVETPSVYECKDIPTVENVYQKYITKARKELDYEIDGLVVEVDDNFLALEIGGGAKPDYARAYKFPHGTGEAVLRSVEWQVGPTGRITPVAVFSPVQIAGASIERASLATEGRVLELGLRAGSRVLVARRNDVIPRIEEVIDAGFGKKIQAPQECPVCGYEVAREGEYLLCPNAGACPAQVQGAVSTWLSELGILEWGDAAVEALCSSGVVKDPADLYNLQDWRLADLQLSGRKIGPANARTMIQNLRAKMDLPLHVFVGALGIPMMGKTMCKTLVDAGFDTLESMREASVSELCNVPGMGRAKAEAFVEGLAGRKKVIEKLLKVGVRIKGVAVGAMKGKSVCMTGFRDAAMADEIERQGGSVKSGVSRGLTYLVQKDPKSMSEKSKKAHEYGTEIISIEHMWRLLGR